MLSPRELAAVNDGASHGCAMAAHVFGQGVHHDICTMLDRAQQIGAWDRVINDQWDAVVMGHFGKGRNVRDIAQGVAN